MQSLSVLFVSLASLATASTLVGNPTTGLTVLNGNDVYIDSVEVFDCGVGSDVIDVDATLDDEESTSFDIDTGTYCAMKVHLRWAPLESLTSVEVDGFDTLIVSSSGSTLTVELDAHLRDATVE